MRELRQRIRAEQSPNSVKEHIIQPSESNKRLYRRLAVFFVFAFAIIVSIGVTFYQQHSAINAKEKQVKELSEELSTLKSQEKKLKEEVKKLNDEEHVLQIARRDYFFSGEGEVIFPISK